MLWPLIIIVYPLFHILRLSPSPLHLRTLRVKTAGGGGLGRSGLRGSGSGLSKRWEWSRQEVGVAWEGRSGKEARTCVPGTHLLQL